MFEGRVAIVTGGTRGIGAAITEMLAKSGAHVAAGYSKGKEPAETCVARLKAEMGRVTLREPYTPSTAG